MVTHVTVKCNIFLGCTDAPGFQQVRFKECIRFLINLLVVSEIFFHMCSDLKG